MILVMNANTLVYMYNEITIIKFSEFRNELSITGSKP